MASIQKVINVTKQGSIANSAVLGVGVGTFVNVADKKWGGGKLTATGISLGQTLNGKPLCLNLTDAITLGVVQGFNIRNLRRGLVAGLITIGAKKVFEAFDYIDPPTPNAVGQVPQQLSYVSTASAMPPTVH